MNMKNILSPTYISFVWSALMSSSHLFLSTLSNLCSIKISLCTWISHTFIALLWILSQWSTAFWKYCTEHRGLKARPWVWWVDWKDGFTCPGSDATFQKFVWCYWIFLSLSSVVISRYLSGLSSALWVTSCSCLTVKPCMSPYWTDFFIHSFTSLSKCTRCFLLCSHQ